MYDQESEFVYWYELDVLGNVRRLRGGPHTVSWEPNFQLPTDLGGYSYTAIGVTLPADAGAPTPTSPQTPQPLRAISVRGHAPRCSFRGRESAS